MKLSVIHIAAALAATLGTISASGSSFATTNVSSYLNANIARNPQTVPLGISDGNQATNIPFNLATFNGRAGSWIASASTNGVLDVHVDVSGEASFYALLNNYFGTSGIDEYDITLKATNGDRATYTSIGGLDTRDYNSNIYTNTIASTTLRWLTTE